jgi:hypothetical protein
VHKFWISSPVLASILASAMASHHPSPPAGMQLHHGPPAGPPPTGMVPQQQQWPASQQMSAMNEAVWLQIGNKCGTESI